MADDEGTERSSEDLFEDLDKFFAPIQDVDWPEEGAEGAAGAKPAEPPLPAAEVAAGPDDDVFVDPLDQPIAWEEPAAPAEPEDVVTVSDPEPEPASPARDFVTVSEPEPVREPEAPLGAEPAEPAFGAGPGDSGNLADDMFGAGSGQDHHSLAGEPSLSSEEIFSAEAVGDAGAEEDLLPQGWASGLDEGIDLDVEVPAAGGEPPAGRFLGEPTAEMSGEDWAELQSGTGDPIPVEEAPREPYSYMEQFMPDQGEPEVPEFGYGPDPGAGAAPSGGTTGIDWDTPAAGTAAGAGAGAGATSLEDSGPISIDDLRRAPDEYQDLPGPEGDDPLGPAIPGYAGADERVEPGPLPGFDDEEPAAGDVEAAAEHFAASIREEDPDLGLSADPFAFAAGLEEPGAPARDPFADDPLDSDHGAEAALLAGAAAHREPYSDDPEPLVFPDDEESDGLLGFGEPEGPRTVKVSAAEGTGPSWQEPTSVEVPVEGEHEPPKPGRNLSAAIVTGIVLAVVAAIALLLGKPWFAFVAGAVIALAQIELYTAIRKRGYQPAVPLGLAVGVLISIGGYTNGEAGILAMTAVGALFTPLWFMATPARLRRNVTANMGMTLLGIMAVPFFGGFAMAIIDGTSRAFTIVILALAFGFDIVAYAIGTIAGNKPLAPTISPNKTREGVYGGFIVLAIAGFTVVGNIDPLQNVWQGVAVALTAAAAATLGDLAESLIKRDLGVKDMGAIFPGHGGALDRIDSILFVAPAVYYVMRILLT